MLKFLGYFAIFQVVSYALIFLIQLWGAGSFGTILSPTIFLKITITYAIVFAITVSLYFILRYLKSEDDLKKDKYVD